MDDDSRDLAADYAEALPLPLAVANGGVPNDDDSDVDVPDALRCPITRCALVNAVMTPCGHTFDRDALAMWLTGRDDGTCPTCRQAVSLDRVVPNFAVRSMAANAHAEAEALLRQVAAEEAEAEALCRQVVAEEAEAAALRRQVVAEEAEAEALRQRRARMARAARRRVRAPPVQRLQARSKAAVAAKRAGVVTGAAVVTSGVFQLGALTAALNVIPFVAVSCVAPPVAIAAGFAVVTAAVNL